MDIDELIAPDLILLLLHAPTRWPQAQDRINGVTRLEKLLFLLNQECKQARFVDEPFKFVPYHYGPYSKEVYEAVELLEEAGLLTEHRQLTEFDLDRAEELLYSDTATEISYERQFILTVDGKEIASYLAKSYQHLHKQIASLKDQYAGLILEELVYRVYHKYPEFTTRSTIRDRVVRV